MVNGTAFNIPNNSIDYADISANMAQNGYLNNTGSFEFEEQLLSTFLRGEYSYKYKYIISGILKDGSVSLVQIIDMVFFQLSQRPG